MGLLSLHMWGGNQKNAFNTKKKIRMVFTRYKTMRTLFGTELKKVEPGEDATLREEFRQHSRLLKFTEQYMHRMQATLEEIVKLHDDFYALLCEDHLSAQAFPELPHTELSWIQRFLASLMTEVSKFDRCGIRKLHDSMELCDQRLTFADTCVLENGRYEQKLQELEEGTGHLRYSENRLQRNKEKLDAAHKERELALRDSRLALLEITKDGRHHLVEIVANTLRVVAAGLGVPMLLAQETEESRHKFRRSSFFPVEVATAPRNSAKVVEGPSRSRSLLAVEMPPRSLSGSMNGPLFEIDIPLRR
eukprot:GEMP01075658.1.p1 GENE.GEMP01075658.1~~GEMP01075658.1.p1  ORF type:complete len:305 (+),score=56.98 GEMP01075658.1:96-1010(+)